MNISIGFTGESKTKADLLVFGQFEDDANPPKVLQAIEPAAFGAVRTVIQKKRFSGKEGEQYSTFNDQFRRTSQILMLGLGKKDSWSSEKFRKRTAGILNYSKSQKR